MTLEERVAHLEREVGRLAAQYTQLASGEALPAGSSVRSKTLAQVFATLERVGAEIDQLNRQMNPHMENGSEA